MIELSAAASFFTFMSPLGFKTSLAAASCFVLYCLTSLLFFMIPINEMETSLLKLTFVLFQLLKASRIEDRL